MKRTSIALAVLASLALAACEKTAPAGQEPAPIEGLWKVMKITAYSYDTGLTSTIDLRDLSGPLTLSFKDGMYESRGSLRLHPEMG